MTWLLRSEILIDKFVERIRQNPVWRNRPVILIREFDPSIQILNVIVIMIITKYTFFTVIWKNKYQVPFSPPSTIRRGELSRGNAWQDGRNVNDLVNFLYIFLSVTAPIIQVHALYDLPSMFTDIDTTFIRNVFFFFLLLPTIFTRQSREWKNFVKLIFFDCKKLNFQITPKIVYALM